MHHHKTPKFPSAFLFFVFHFLSNFELLNINNLIDNQFITHQKTFQSVISRKQSDKKLWLNTSQLWWKPAKTGYFGIRFLIYSDNLFPVRPVYLWILYLNCLLVLILSAIALYLFLSVSELAFPPCSNKCPPFAKEFSLMMLFLICAAADHISLATAISSSLNIRLCCEILPFAATKHTASLHTRSAPRWALAAFAYPRLRYAHLRLLIGDLYEVEKRCPRQDESDTLATILKKNN